MGTVNEKLAKFKIDCINQASKDAEDLQLKLRNEINLQVSEELEPFNKKQEIKFNKSMKNLEKEFRANCYKLEVDARQQIIQRQDEIKADFKKSLEDKILKFVKTKKYETFLIKSIVETMNKIERFNNNKDMVLYLTKRDKKNYEDIINKTFDNIKIETIDDSYIGGCKCINKESNIYVDNTLKLAIEEQVKDRRW